MENKNLIGDLELVSTAISQYAYTLEQINETKKELDYIKGIIKTCEARIIELNKAMESVAIMLKEESEKLKVASKLANKIRCRRNASELHAEYLKQANELMNIQFRLSTAKNDKARCENFLSENPQEVIIALIKDQSKFLHEIVSDQANENE